MWTLNFSLVNNIFDSWAPWIATLTISGISAFVLQYLFKTISTKWPESYTSISQELDLQVRSNPLRSLIAFRLFPTFIIVLFNAVIVERVEGNAWLGLYVFLLIYIGRSNALAIKNELTSPRRNNVVVLVLYHLFIIIFLVVTAAAATSLRYRLESWVPPSKDLLIALWAGLFAAVLSTFSRELLTAPKANMGETIEMLIADIGKSNWDFVGVACAQGGNENLVRAILLAEAQQRPRWFRRLERIKGILFRDGSYGVAQVRADRPISDAESIEKLARIFAGYVVPLNEYDQINEEVLKFNLLDHNDDTEHARRIVSFYSYLTYYYSPSVKVK